MNRLRLVIVMALAAVSGSTAFADITAWFAPSAFKVMRDARPAVVGVDGPVGSLRLEVVQDGLEDFDYFTLADEWLGPEASAAYVNRIARSLTDFDADPVKLEKVRREVGAELEKASRNALRASRRAHLAVPKTNSSPW
jgi:hypothetical protein